MILINKCTELSYILQDFTTLYRIITHYTMLYRNRLYYTGLNHIIDDFTGLYHIIHANKRLYRIIPHYNRIYNIIQDYTHKSCIPTGVSIQSATNRMVGFLSQKKILSIWNLAQWLRCCAPNWKVAGSIPDGVIGIFSST